MRAMNVTVVGLHDVVSDSGSPEHRENAEKVLWNGDESNCRLGLASGHIQETRTTEQGTKLATH